MCFITLAVGSVSVDEEGGLCICKLAAAWWCRLQVEDGGAPHSSSPQPISRAPKLVCCYVCQRWSPGGNRCYVCLQSTICKSLLRNGSGRVHGCKSGLTEEEASLLASSVR